eukprot:PhF_6_TR22512/c0_g1_i2/m.31937
MRRGKVLAVGFIAAALVTIRFLVHSSDTLTQSPQHQEQQQQQHVEVVTTNFPVAILPPPNTKENSLVVNLVPHQSLTASCDNLGKTLSLSIPSARGLPPTAESTPYPSLTTFLSCDGKCSSSFADACAGDNGRLYVHSNKHVGEMDKVSTCNEGGSKREIDITILSGKSKRKYTSKEVLHVLYCWDYYGYHLWICLATLYAHMMRRGVTTEGQKQNIVYGLTSVAGMNSVTKFGSWESWDNIENSDAASWGKNAYWKLWSIVASEPSHVKPLALVPRGCYRQMIVGSPDPGTVTPKEWQSFSRAVKQLYHLPLDLPSSGLCDSYNITILERKKNYHILNVDNVALSFRTVFNAKSFQKVSVRVVRLEEMSLEEQLRVVAQSQVLVGLHGNGLTWSALLPPRAVVVEIWPRMAYNSNYFRFARLSGLKHLKVEHGGKGKGRYDVYVNTLMVEDVAKTAAEHLQECVCKNICATSTNDESSTSTNTIQEIETLLGLLRGLQQGEWKQKYNIQKHNAKYAFVLTLGGFKKAGVACYKYLKFLPPASHEKLEELKHYCVASPDVQGGSQRARCLGAVEIIRYLRSIGKDVTAEDVTAPNMEEIERKVAEEYQRKRQQEFWAIHPEGRKNWIQH